MNGPLDVAAICLGKMEHAAGARALRQINAQNVEKDVKTAVLAVYLVTFIELIEKKNFVSSFILIFFSNFSKQNFKKYIISGHAGGGRAVADALQAL